MTHPRRPRQRDLPRRPAAEGPARGGRRGRPGRPPRVAGLLEAGAQVTVVSPGGHPRAGGAGAPGSLAWLPRRYEAGDLAAPGTPSRPPTTPR